MLTFAPVAYKQWMVKLLMDGKIADTLAESNPIASKCISDHIRHHILTVEKPTTGVSFRSVLDEV